MAKATLITRVRALPTAASTAMSAVTVPAGMSWEPVRAKRSASAALTWAPRVVRARERRRERIPRGVQEASDASSSRTFATVGTRPDRTTFSSTTSPGVDMTP